jgi:hypothetical protein
MKIYDQSQNIVLKEYGRNIQKIVAYLLSIEDREKRSRFAYTLIELMKQINPGIRDVQENDQKIWDHLYIISDFKLDVDTEFPMPEKSILDKKPMNVAYNTHKLKFKHYGQNVELLIKQAIEISDPEEKENAAIFIGKIMKRFYSAWNKENTDDELIAQQLELISEGKLKVDLEKVRANNLFDSQREYNRPSSYSQSSYQNSAAKNNNYRKGKKPIQHRKRG